MDHHCVLGFFNHRCMTCSMNPETETAVTYTRGHFNQVMWGLMREKRFSSLSSFSSSSSFFFIFFLIVVVH